MMRTLAQAARVCGGTLVGADAPFAAVSTDSRTLARGDLFVALGGERFDGHDFVEAAARAGAVGALVARRAHAGAGAGLPQILVPDPLAALAALARFWRGQWNLPVIGVAGSNGKTTVKEMTAAILGLAGPCLATRGNLNNHIGVPLTLMHLRSEHLSAVIEIGANHPGEVAALAALAQPTIGLVTNAGAEHLEGFGDLDGVAASEGEIVAALPADGVAVINADDVYAPLWRRMSTAGRMLTFSLTPTADFHAEGIVQSIENGEFRLRCTLHARPRAATAQLELKLAGRHNVRNALAAAAAAHAAGASLTQIVDGLAELRPVRGRLELKRARGGAWLLDDTYNANPGSLEAALEVLGELPGERWLALTDMAELGAFAESSHVAAGASARRHGVTRLFTAGPLSAHAARSFGAGATGLPDVAALAGALATELHSGVTVLIKGSRFNRLETVVEALASEVD